MALFLKSMIALATAAYALPQSRPQLHERQSSCSSLELVISRGTSEFGTYGFIVGDNLVPAVQKLIPSATAYAVPYPADFSDGSVPTGVAAVQSHLSSQSTSCPDQKFVIVGYSQGAVVSHDAIGNLSSVAPTALEKIIGLVMFGDPYLKSTNPTDPNGRPISAFPAQLQSDVYENCAPSDPVCQPSGVNILDHLSYSGGSYISDSASFINQQYDASS